VRNNFIFSLLAEAPLLKKKEPLQSKSPQTLRQRIASSMPTPARARYMARTVQGYLAEKIQLATPCTRLPW
jgi:hypothetical protein